MTEIDECQQQETLTRRCLEAVQAIENVLAAQPRERHQIIDFGECAIVQLRDCLIERCRQAYAPESQAAPDFQVAPDFQAAPEVQARLKAALKQANIALSLITGVEYPGAGIQEAPLQMARDVLKGIKV